MNIFKFDFIYWIKSFLIRKDHLLDIRECDRDKQYKWGYIDPCEIVEMSLYKTLQRYIAEINSFYGGIDKAIESMQKIADNDQSDDTCKGLQQLDNFWLDHYLMIKEIYNFFEIEYSKLVKENEELFKEYIKNKDSNLRDKYYEQEAFIDNKVEYYLIQIVKQRKYMWT